MRLRTVLNGDDSTRLIDDFYEALESQTYTSISWAVSSYTDEWLIDELFIPNAEKFKHLYISGKWNSNAGKDNSIKWRNIVANAKNKLEGYSCVKFINAVSIFHPKVYLFYNDDHSEWIAFIGSLNLTLSDFNTIESVAIVTQDDDTDGSLFDSILKMFTKDIPLSNNITGNKRAQNKAKCEEDNKYYSECELQVKEDLSKLLQELMPIVSGKRNFEILSRYILGETRIDLADAYGISAARIGQICIRWRFKTAIKSLAESPDKSVSIKAILDRLNKGVYYHDYLKAPQKGQEETRKKLRIRFIKQMNKTFFEN